MKRPKSEFQALQRKQLDAKLAAPALRSLQKPREGWIRAIRSALGMSADQLGKRLSISRQGVTDLEKRESDETISLNTLRKAAQALESDLMVVIVPRDSLENIVRERARQKAVAERNRVVHTMRLEDQESGITDVLDLDKSIEAWLTNRATQLWD